MKYIFAEIKQRRCCTGRWTCLSCFNTKPDKVAANFKPSHIPSCPDSIGECEALSLFTDEDIEDIWSCVPNMHQWNIRQTHRQRSWWCSETDKKRKPTWISCQLEWMKSEKAVAAQRVASMKTCQWTSDTLLNGTKSAKRKAPFHLSVWLSLSLLSPTTGSITGKLGLGRELQAGSCFRIWLTPNPR